MAVVHRTTLTPGKLELLAAWLPRQPWYAQTGREPDLAKAGGFRLDDPDGEVGIEFMAITDGSGDRAATYHVPLSYRGAPLSGAEHALIGTADHGVLGQRWVYDGAHDPVLVAQLLALIRGEAEPQDQDVSGTADRSVSSRLDQPGDGVVIRSMTVADGPDGTDLILQTVTAGGPDRESAGELAIRVARNLQPAQDMPEARGYVTGTWRSPGGTKARGLFAVVR